MPKNLAIAEATSWESGSSMVEWLCEKLNSARSIGREIDRNGSPRWGKE
ncbi:MAG TPA: hypothetical protein IGS31_18875 [Oscillatoriales cyanobacterium M4454_W2019_049]|nr:hypothetical protein [Oscillatoriales cyanobacterium M4454_W2019_049]